jgi:AcrR family transcriptional regulator
MAKHATIDPSPPAPNHAGADAASTWRYGELTEADVVDAALQFARRDGLAKLTMRKLATELGVSSTNAYYYVPSKGALLDLVADAILGQVPEPPPEITRWDDQLRFLFEHTRSLLLEHPGVSDHLLARSEGRGQQRRLYLLSKSIMANAGFDKATINHAQRAMTYLLLGAVSQELATAHAPSPGSTTPRFPDDEQVFEFGLDLMLEGLRLRRPKRRSTSRGKP